MKRLSLLLLLCTAAHAQNWFNVGKPSTGFSANAAITARVGYNDTTGQNWISFTEVAGKGWQAPSTVALANPSNLPLEVDVLQGTPVTVTAQTVYAGACYVQVTTTIPAIGNAAQTTPACGGATTTVAISPVVQPGTPPVVTPPVVTPPVVTPPVTQPVGFTLNFTCVFPAGSMKPTSCTTTVGP